MTLNITMTTIKDQKILKGSLITVLGSVATDQSCFFFLFLNFHINQWLSPEGDFVPGQTMPGNIFYDHSEQGGGRVVVGC